MGLRDCPLKGCAYACVCVCYFQYFVDICIFNQGLVNHLSHWKVVAEPLKMLGFLASGGEEFNPRPETRLDSSELLCNKVLLKYKGDRESFWHRHQKGTERIPTSSSLAGCYIVTSSLLMKERNVLKLREWHQVLHPQDVFWDNLGTLWVILGHKIVDLNLVERQITIQIVLFI